MHVRGPEGVRTSRRHHRLLGLHATWGPAGEPLVDGLPWDARRGARARSGRRRAPTRELARYDGVERFDVLPLLVATDGAIAAFGRDVRRLRPNIVIGGVDGMDEVMWPGAELHIGEVVIRLDSRRGRCPMTTVDPDTLERDPEVLKDIIRRFDGKLALNADVVRPGVVHIGDEVRLVPSGQPLRCSHDRCAARAVLRSPAARRVPRPGRRSRRRRRPRHGRPRAADAVIAGMHRWDAAAMAAGPRLRVISRIGVGYDTVDVAAATAAGITVCYAPAAPTVSTAEHAVALMMSITKGLDAAQARAAEGLPGGPATALELDGRVLGLLGYGRIARRVALVGAALGMDVIAHDPVLTESDGVARAGVVRRAVAHQRRAVVARPVAAVHPPRGRTPPRWR